MNDLKPFVVLVVGFNESQMHTVSHATVIMARDENDALDVAKREAELSNVLAKSVRPLEVETMIAIYQYVVENDI